MPPSPLVSGAWGSPRQGEVPTAYGKYRHTRQYKWST